ncbi:MAG: hypothetical protein K6A42_06070 [Treponema sp.]|nr:hypothetical protein [Treponema sp.]
MIFKKLFKISLAFFALALASASLFAIDFGGALSSASKFKGNKFSNLKFDQVNDLNLWVKVPFKNDGSIYFTAEGLYEFEASDTDIFNRLDLSLFKFQGLFKFKQNKLNLSAGRFSYSDITGVILNQNADGLFVNYEGSYFMASAYASYTGLLNAAIVKMLDHPSDAFKHDTNAVYELAQKYFLASASFSLPYLFSCQNLTAQFLGAFKVEGKSYNRMYASLSFGGPLYKTLYYSLASTLGMQNFDGGSFDISNMSSAKFSWFLPFKDLTVNGGAVYASGSHGPFEAFRGFTKMDAYNALNEPQYSGLVKFSLSASAKPINVLLIYGGADAILNAASTSIKYKGFQYSVGADWQIFSDVKAGLSFLQYFDNDNSDLDKIQISLNASIIF